MAFDFPLAYIRYEFSWRGTDEIQNFGFFMRKTDTDPYPNPGEAAAAQAIADKGVSAFHANILPGAFAAQVIATRCTAYTMQADGVHVSEKGVTAFSGGTSWQGAETQAFPPQLSPVLSLYALDPGSFQGANPGTKRGRVYLPTPGTGAGGNDGSLQSSVASDMLDQWQGWYDDVTGVITLAGGTFHLVPVVRSLGGKRGPSAETTYDVAWLRMGLVFDTQRRRRDKLSEAYLNHQLS